MSAPVALHLAPHPDDEAIGAVAALLALRAAGWRVINYACGLGRPEQHLRRRAEVEEACRRAGFDLVIGEPPLAMSRGDDLVRAEDELVRRLADLAGTLAPVLVVSPSVHDGHHAHELVARAARRLIEHFAYEPPTWWMWGLWADLPFPTLVVPCDEARLALAGHALAAHAGEVERNDYVALIGARARANAVLGAERVFGTGAPALPEATMVELLCESALTPRGWLLGAPRLLDPACPLAPPSDRPIGWWLLSESPRDALARHRAENGNPDAASGQ